MKFKLTDTNGSDLGFIEITTIEELMKLRDEKGHPLIISYTYDDEPIPEIEIYDGYRE